MNRFERDVMPATRTRGDVAREEWIALFRLALPTDDRTFRRILLMAFIMGQVSTDETAVEILAHGPQAV